MHYDVTADEAKRIEIEADARAERHVRQRRSIGRPRIDGFEAWYTIPQLAVMGRKSPRQVEGPLLEKAKLYPGLIEQAGPGKKRRIYISVLKRAWPEFYESLLDIRDGDAQRAA